MTFQVQFYPATLTDPACPTEAYGNLLDELDEVKDEIRCMDEARELWQELNKFQFPALQTQLSTINQAVEAWFMEAQTNIAEKLARLKEEADVFGEPWK